MKNSVENRIIIEKYYFRYFPRIYRNEFNSIILIQMIHMTNKPLALSGPQHTS